MKSIPSPLLLSLAALLVAGRVFAQSADVSHLGAGAGLLGTKFSGVEFGYTHHVESPPDEMQRFGLVSQAPIPEITNVDGAFRYDYTRGTGGLKTQRHRVTGALVRYFIHGSAKPFVDVEIGWAWRKIGATKQDSFFYRGRLGAELGINPNVAVTPFLAYQEASNISERAWSYGAKLAYRMNQNFLPMIGIEVDEKHNIEYTLAARYRY